MNLKQNKQTRDNVEPLAPITNISRPLAHHPMTSGMTSRQMSEYSSPYFDSGMPWPPAHDYEEARRNFALNNAGSSTKAPRDEAPEPTIHIQRSSFASFESLERRMASRATKDDQQSTTYSSAALRTMLFVKRKLSIGSVASNCSKSTISSSGSKRISWSSIDSTLTVTGPIPSATRASIATDTGSITSSRRSSTATLKKSTLSNETGGLVTMSQVTPVEPFKMSDPPAHFPPVTDLSPPSPPSLQGTSASKSTSTKRPRWQLRLKRSQKLPRNDPLWQSIATQVTEEEADDQMIFVTDLENWHETSSEPIVSTIADDLAADALLEENYFLQPPTPDVIHGLDLSDETLNLVPLIPEPDISSANERLSISSEMDIESFEEKTTSNSEQISVFAATKARDCCRNLRRGDPRASTCLPCQLSEPDSHRIIRLAVKAWQDGDNTALWQIPALWQKQLVTLDQVDMFHNTLLHTAARHGAGSATLMWLIDKGVNVHALNAAGQTFMHVLNPVSFDGHTQDIYHGGTEDFHGLFFALQIQKFNFLHLDDYGQTLLHVLTQYWMHSDAIAAAFGCMNLTATCKPPGRDFRGRTIDLQLQAQVMKEDQNIADSDRQVKITEFILPKPSGDWYKAPENSRVVSEQSVHATHSRLHATVNHALIGYPEEEDLGRNGLHCLAESGLTYNSDSGLFNQLKRKYQQQNKTTHQKRILNTVEGLCAAGVDVNNYDLNGNTPLMAFIKHELTPSPTDRSTSTAVLQLLISNGANVHRRNRKGETALHIAARLGRPAAFELLLANHASVNARTGRGKSVLDVATKASVKGAKRDTGLYVRIVACINIAVRYGAVMKPDVKTEWDERVKYDAKGPTSTSTTASRRIWQELRELGLLSSNTG